MLIDIEASTLAKILNENERLQKRVDELQAAGTEKLMASLPRVVRAFHKKFNHPIASTPHVPDEEQVRFRMRLITEEYMELLEAVYGSRNSFQIELEDHVRHGVIRINLPELTDAMADLEWVIEGTRAVFGIHGASVMAEVARANMEKEPAQVVEKDEHHRSAKVGAIKPVKPEGWKAPDIRGVLLQQGWRP